MFRFTIRDMLWLTVLTAVLMAWWLEQPSRRPSLSWFTKPLHAKVYYVEDLLALQSSGHGVVAPWLNGLASDIKDNVTRDDWESSGGLATIKTWDTNVSLVVCHSEEGHAQVAEYLAAKRQSAPSH